MSKRLTGVWLDALTPLKANLDVDLALWTSHLRTISTRGITQFVLFGHAGEGASFGAREKLTAIQHLIGQGFDPASFLLGVSSSVVAEVAWMIREAHALGVRRFLVPPPLHVHPVLQSGICQYFGSLIAKVQRPDWHLYLHLLGHPGPSGVADAAMAALQRDHSDHLAGIVDQGRIASRTMDYLKSFGEHWSVTPTEETQLRTIKSSSVVSIQANLIPQVIHHVLGGKPSAQGGQIVGLKVREPDERLQELSRMRGDLSDAVFYKHFMTLFSHRPEWDLVRPPYSPVPEQELKRLEKAFTDFKIQPGE